MTLLQLTIIFIAPLYIICYASLEDYLAKRMKESSYLNLMVPSRRLIAIIFLYGSLKGIFKVFKILVLLVNSKTPTGSDIISAILLSFILILTIRYRKTTWYYLTKNKRTILADWYIRKYFDLSKKEYKQAYEYLEKASKFKTDSVFIWSMMALFNQFHFEKPDLTDEYLTKAQETLDTNKETSLEDKATLESAKGEIMLRRDNIDKGLHHLKNARDLNPSPFHKETYEKALKWAEEDENLDGT